MKISIRRHLGRRGASALLYALLWVGIGVERQMFGDRTPFPPDAAMAFHNWLDPHDRAYLWIGTALIAIVVTLWGPRHMRWPMVVAYLALVVMPLLNVVTYFWSGLMYVWPGAPGGLASSVVQFFVWSGIFVKIGIVDAGWDEDVEEAE